MESRPLIVRRFCRAGDRAFGRLTPQMSSFRFPIFSWAPLARVLLEASIAIHSLGEVPMLVNKSANREWSATDHVGIERSLFRNNETGGRSPSCAWSKDHDFHGTPTTVPKKLSFSPEPSPLVVLS
jgi:hypothetical protein